MSRLKGQSVTTNKSTNQEIRIKYLLVSRLPLCCQPILYAHLTWLSLVQRHSHIQYLSSSIYLLVVKSKSYFVSLILQVAFNDLMHEIITYPDFIKSSVKKFKIKTGHQIIALVATTKLEQVQVFILPFTSRINKAIALNCIEL